MPSKTSRRVSRSVLATFTRITAAHRGLKHRVYIFVVSCRYSIQQRNKPGLFEVPVGRKGLAQSTLLHHDK